jgi:hypothetical protein
MLLTQDSESEQMRIAGWIGMVVVLALATTVSPAGALDTRYEKAQKEARKRTEEAKAKGLIFSTINPDGSIEFREVKDGPVRSLSIAEYERFIQARYIDQTTMTNSGQHGWQVEYTSADGKAFLWYPGNDRLVLGTWRTRIKEFPIAGQPTRHSVMICFTYADSYNPATGVGPDQEECTFPSMNDIGMPKTERRPGDLFKLGGGKLPYQRGAKDKPAWPEAGTPPFP